MNRETHAYKRPFMQKTLTIVVGSVALFGASAPLHAESYELEEVIVTAQMRTESLQDVPISVNAVSNEKMAEAGIQKIEDLSAYVPNLSMSESPIGSSIAIRGVSSGTNQGFEQSVGMYVDNIYYGRAQQSRFPFLDLERVEVLRGPQGILFGKNTIAGAISMISAKPTEEFEGEFSVLYEPDHEELILTGILSGPITDNLTGRLAVRTRDMDGWLNDIGVDDKVPNRDEQALRATLAWDVNQNLDITLKVETGDFDVKGRTGQILQGGGFPILTSDPEFNETRAYNEEYSNNEVDNIVLTGNVSVGEHRLTLTTGYSTYEWEELTDGDNSPTLLFSDRNGEEYEQYSQEVRLVSPTSDSFEYIAGIYYQTNKLDFHEEFIFSPNLPIAPLRNTSTARKYGQDTDTWAIFAQGTWHIRDNLRLAFGGRYTEEDKDAFRTLGLVDDTTGTELTNPAALGTYAFINTFAHSLEGNRKESSFTPSINLQFDLSGDTMLYASASSGFKSGGYDARSNTALSWEFEDENATAIEMGFKTVLLNGTAELNGAFFYTEYDDLQTTAFDGGIGFTVGNAATAITQGVELDGRWRVSEGLTLSGSLSHLDFEFEEWDDGNCYLGQTPTGIGSTGLSTCSMTGRENQYTPEWSASLSANYVYPIGENLELKTSIDANFVDNYYTTADLDPALEQHAVTKINARIALSDTDGNWEVALLGRNLTDELTYSFGNDVPLSGPAPAYYVITERPRSIAIDARFSF